MRRFSIILALITLGVVISSCDVISDFFSSNCSSFNKSLDGFKINIQQTQLVLQEGASIAIDIERSWLNDDLIRESLSCDPDWRYEPEGIAQVTDNVVEAIKSGITRVEAVVTGSGGTKQDSLWVAVTPPANESEPNNGIPAAVRISFTMYGFINAFDDTDWFYFDVPPGKGYQVTLDFQPKPISGDPFSSPRYRGDLFDENGLQLGFVNVAYNNDTGTTLRVFTKITGPIAEFPYALSASLF